MAALGLGHCHDLVMLGACPSPCTDYLVSYHLLCALAGVSTRIKEQEWDLTALESIISSQLASPWCCGFVAVWGTLFYLLSVNKVKDTVFKD